MSWTAPRTWVAGAVVTAAQLNVDIRDNENALAAGYMAVASQAQYDTFYASSTTQLARLANGTTGQVMKATSGAAPAWGSAGIKPYTVTMTDVVSTNVETDFISMTIAAAEWADTEYVYIKGYLLHKNNSGGGATLTPKIYIQGTAVASMPSGNVSFTNSINETKVWLGLILQREGSNVFYGQGVPTDPTVLFSGNLGAVDWALSGTQGALPWTPNFANSIIIKMSVTPSTSSANLYVKPRGFIAHKFGV